jgi:signal transduction histidine kinase
VDDDGNEAAQALRRFGWARSVRVRLTALATLVFALALSGAAWGLVSIVHSHMVDSIKATNKAELDALATQLQRGTQLNSLRPKDFGDTWAPVIAISSDGTAHVIGAVPRFQGQRHYDTTRVINTTAGEVTLVAQRSLADVDRAVHTMTTSLLFAVPSLIVLVAAAAWYFAGRALRPVEAIRVEAESITGSTIHRRVPEPDTGDEVGRLAHTMNAMLDRLESSAQRQRRFVSDASHELRSPLAAIRTTLEVALRNSDRADWPVVAARVLSEDARMEDTVTELLDLARLDEHELDVASLPEVDLDDVVLEAASEPCRVPVDTTRVSAGRVRGRRDQLARMMRNLLDNACRHADSVVALSLRTEDGVVEVCVDDDGPGIPPEKRETVFERFTRLDEGRARDAGGMGIGLAIVKGVVEQHGGTVVVDDAPLGGARLTLRLPEA